MDDIIRPDLVLDERSLPALSDDDLVETIARLKALGEQAAIIRQDAERIMAERMGDDDRVSVGDYLVTRTRSSTASWDGDRARSAAKAAIVQRLCVDPMTGEIHRPLAHAVEQAVDLAFSLGSQGAKSGLATTGLKGLQLDPNDFREMTYGAWRIKLDEVTE